MTTPAATPSLRQIALGDLEHELALTRRVLERVPEEHFGWKPHEKSMSLGRLAAHLANLLRWQVITLQHDAFDLAASPPPADVPASREALLKTFDANLAALREAMEQADDALLSRPWTLRYGEKVVMQQPKVAVLRGMVISHIIHHRGQLSVYLRLLDVPVPAIYGPSADEPAF
jgi:uncharacterized damage-inducible protein DinB